MSRRRAVALPAPVALAGERLGLLSDSHEDALETRRAVSALCERGADALLHLGDLCADAVLDELAGAVRDGRSVPARFVCGNMDLDPRDLARYAAHLAVACDHPIGVYDMAGKRIVAHHGHYDGVEEAAIESGAAYYLHGHTHRPRDEVIGSTRIINPGALHRATRHTCALLTPATGVLEVVVLTPGGAGA